MWQKATNPDWGKDNVAEPLGQEPRCFAQRVELKKKKITHQLLIKGFSVAVVSCTQDFVV